jgi:hypothetical protein
MKSKLDHYKGTHNCEYDGQAVLRAAKECLFLKTVCRPSNQLLKDLGVETKINRNEIITLFSQPMEPDDFELSQMVDLELKRRQQEDNVRYLPEEARKKKEEIQNEIIQIRDQVIQFCVQSLESFEESQRESKKEKKSSMVNRIFDLFENMLGLF